jgi:hypothetical protein
MGNAASRKPNWNTHPGSNSFSYDQYLKNGGYPHDPSNTDPRTEDAPIITAKHARRAAEAMEVYRNVTVPYDKLMYQVRQHIQTNKPGPCCHIPDMETALTTQDPRVLKRLQQNGFYVNLTEGTICWQR